MLLGFCRNACASSFSNVHNFMEQKEGGKYSRKKRGGDEHLEISFFLFFVRAFMCAILELSPRESIKSERAVRKKVKRERERERGRAREREREREREKKSRG